MGIGTLRELNNLKKEYEEGFEDLMRLARLRKRKCAADGNSEPNSAGNATKKRRNLSSQVEQQMVDMDYEQYLNDLDEDDVVGLDLIDVQDDDVYVNSQSVGHDDDNIQVRYFGDFGDDDDVDPHYKMFLENLREDGKSYVLEVVQENGDSKLIKFEQEDGMLDGSNLYTPEILKNSQVKEKTEVKKTLRRGGVKRERMNFLNNSAFLLNKEGIESPRTVRYVLRKNNRETLEDSKDLPKKNSSVVKKAKVGALDPVSGRKSGRSNKTSGLEGPNTPEAFESLLKEKTEIKRTPWRFMKKKKIKIDRTDRSAHTLIKEETRNFRSFRYVTRDRDRVTLQNLEDLPEKKSSMKKKHVNQKVAGSKAKERPIKRPHLEIPHFATCRPVDDDYQRLLNGIKFLGGKVVYTPINGSPHIVLEDVEGSSAPEIKIEPCDESFTSVAAVDVDSGRRIEIYDTSHTQFREGLMKDLKRPYDQKEYDNLWEEMSCHRQKEHDRNLRTVTKTCKVKGKFGESYREHFKVLARKIDAASGDHRRILNLLRGFFYWLQNCAHEGCFCPWTDPSCLKVLPPLGKKREVLPQL